MLRLHNDSHFDRKLSAKSTQTSDDDLTGLTSGEESHYKFGHGTMHVDPPKLLEQYDIIKLYMFSTIMTDGIDRVDVLASGTLIVNEVPLTVLVNSDPRDNRTIVVERKVCSRVIQRVPVSNAFWWVAPVVIHGSGGWA